jgi:hypothetical protein
VSKSCVELARIKISQSWVELLRVIIAESSGEC